VMPRWKRQGEMVSGADEKGTTLVKVPLKEPVLVRPAFDTKYQIARVNCP
jgi:hypothetical protein